MHAVVPGAGPSLDRQRWITAKHPSRSKPWLVNHKHLGKRFRKYYVQGLKKLVRSGELKLEQEWSWLSDSSELDRWCDELEQSDWNVFIEGPPRGESQPRHVLQYLARYLTGGPLSDARLISDESGWVQFYARSKDKRAGNPSLPFRLRGYELVRRWAMHILPKGFTRSRRYGGYHMTKWAGYHRLCEQLNPSKVADKPEQASGDHQSAESASSDGRQCAHCGEAVELISSRRRPSWQIVFTKEVYKLASTYCPLLHRHVRGPPSPRGAAL